MHPNVSNRGGGQGRRRGLLYIRDFMLHQERPKRLDDHLDAHYVLGAARYDHICMGALWSYETLVRRLDEPLILRQHGVEVSPAIVDITPYAS